MSSAPLEAIRAALGGERAWLVGGAVRDARGGRPTDDLDVVLEGDPATAARAVRRAAGGAAFALSDAHGAWRVVGRAAGSASTWQLDLVAIQGGSLEADLGLRDFTLNAMAVPLDAPADADDALVDPFGGREDLANRRLRAVGPAAIQSDALRALRAVRIAAEHGLVIEPDTRALVAAGASGLTRISAERIWAELRRIVAVPDPRPAVETLRELGLTRVVLPELDALDGVEQSVYHHRDVLGHTLEVLDAAVALERDPTALGLEREGARLQALLAEPLADGMTRGEALRWAALLHDVAKPQTAKVRTDGRGTGFPGHHAVGSDVTRDVLRRLRAAERVVGHVAALVRHHLRLGFLVDDGPLTRCSAHRYLMATGDVAADVTGLTVADRVATRGRHAERAIAAHVALADEMLGHALDRRAAGPPVPLVRGDELARELGIAPGPQLGALLAQLAEAAYTGEIGTRSEAIARARILCRG